jgi:ammonia channel protein AmtB
MQHHFKFPPRSGAIVGLVIITPACGYVNLSGAFFMAVIGSFVCYKALRFKKPNIIDDAMDSFAIHGVGGVLGSLLTGLFANDEVTGESRARGAFFNGNWEQVARQLIGVVAVSAWSMSMSLCILLVVDKGHEALSRVTGEDYRLAADEVHQVRGLDITQHDQPEDTAHHDKADAHELVEDAGKAAARLPQQASVVVIPDCVKTDAASAQETEPGAGQGRPAV